MFSGGIYKKDISERNVLIFILILVFILLNLHIYLRSGNASTNGTKNSRINQVNLVEFRLSKIWSDIVCYNKTYHFTIFNYILSQEVNVCSKSGFSFCYIWCKYYFLCSRYHYIGQVIQQWTEQNFWKTAFKKFYSFHSWIPWPI